MTAAQTLYRFLGVRSTETSIVRLFFLHNFFLGIGNILVYVAANVILLENHPLTSLPIAYVVAALAMMAVGRIYTYYEHHLLLKRLAIRVLLAVVILTFVMGAIVWLGHSVVAAVAIMAGYRAIYLLTNLEFWGASAVVFDVRQSKRLFSIISSGDMPAKALGALLSVLVHAHAELFILLLIAFGAFLSAMYVFSLTVKAHVVDVAPARMQLHRRPQPSLIRQLFGGSELVFSMCISLAAIACVVTSIEYFFFVNVKEKFHHQEDVMKFIGTVLVLTYLSAMVFKLLFSWKTFERMGIRWSLAVLPIAGLLSVVVFVLLHEMGTTETGLLIYFCGLYLLLEVLRRAVFDPIFLVLFQPLSPQTRLKGHTLVKGFYEPLGMALAGLLFIGLHHSPALPSWLPFVWIALLMSLALFFLNRTYRSYLDALKNALERRFLASDELLVPTTARKAILANLKSTHTADVLNAIEWLQTNEPDTLVAQSSTLLQHQDKLVRTSLLSTLSTQLEPAVLHHVATTDTESTLRQTAARWLARHPQTPPELLDTLWQQTDLCIRIGTIQGRLEVQSADTVAQQQLSALATAIEVDKQKAALALLPFLDNVAQYILVEQALSSPVKSLQQAAVRSMSTVVSPQLTPKLVELLTSSIFWRDALQSLISNGSASLPYLRATIHPHVSQAFIQRIALICERIASPDSRQLLIELAELPNLFWRASALRALRIFDPIEAESSRFQDLLNEEWQLAQRLIAGIDGEEDTIMVASLEYELTLLIQRIFGLLTQLYGSEVIANAQRGVLHAVRDRKANALEMLDNLIPQPTYRSLQTLVDDMPVAEKLRLLTKFNGPLADPQPIRRYIIQQGNTKFSDWTISLALRSISVDAVSTTSLNHFLDSSNPLIRESALTVVAQLPQNNPDRQQLLTSRTTMTHHQTTQISIVDRIYALKRTSLFASTPENVLSSIAQIMNEVTYHEEQEIFKKGETGTSLFIVYDGEVGIYDGTEQLATFGKGGFFGELALLDAEPRSASAIALTHVLAFRIDQEDFYDLMEERGEVLQNIVRALCQRLRRQNEVLRDLSASV